VEKRRSGGCVGVGRCGVEDALKIVRLDTNPWKWCLSCVPGGWQTGACAVELVRLSLDDDL
jgi:hypothetical protein